MEKEKHGKKYLTTNLEDRVERKEAYVLRTAWAQNNFNPSLGIR